VSAGRGGEQHVVDGATVSLAHAEYIVELDLHHGQSPGRARGQVEGRDGCRVTKPRSADEVGRVSA